MQLTVKEYAAFRRSKVHSVLSTIRRKGKLPGVVRIDKFGPTYVLSVVSHDDIKPITPRKKPN